MAKPAYFPRRIILSGAVIFGVLLALGIHIILQRFDFNLGDLWRTDSPDLIPARAALAWWLVAAAAFVTGFVTASLLDSAASGQLPARLRQFLIAIGVVMLAAAGQAASAPSAVPTLSGMLAGVAALGLGAVMAFCGAHFALRRS